MLNNFKSKEMMKTQERATNVLKVVRETSTRLSLYSFIEWNIIISWMYGREIDNHHS